MVLVRKGSSIKRKSGGSSSITTSTLSADANARQVTRAEFMELAAAVTQLKKDSLRHQAVESQLASDLEFTSAQVAANKTAMGTLAELLIEKTSGIEQQGATQLQTLQVESEQRLTDVKLALERLEFRLRHQARDCQALTEQVERHQELMQTMRTQLGQTQLRVEKQQEHAKTFVETVEYTVSTLDAKSTNATADCTQKLETFQQRMVEYVKKLDGDTQEPLKELSRQLRDVEFKGKRQTSLFQQALDDLVEMRQTLYELENLKALVEREQEFREHTHKVDTQRLQSVERKISKVLTLVEESAERTEVQQLVSRLENNVKTRVEGVLESHEQMTRCRCFFTLRQQQLETQEVLLQEIRRVNQELLLQERRTVERLEGLLATAQTQLTMAQLNLNSSLFLNNKFADAAMLCASNIAVGRMSSQKKICAPSSTTPACHMTAIMFEEEQKSLQVELVTADMTDAVERDVEASNAAFVPGSTVIAVKSEDDATEIKQLTPLNGSTIVKKRRLDATAKFNSDGSAFLAFSIQLPLDNSDFNQHLLSLLSRKPQFRSVFFALSVQCFLDNLQNEATAFQEKKILYDHYARKVAALRENHEKRASNGKSEKTKDTERMFRNEQKLAATTQEYTRLSDTVIRDLRAFVMSRDAALAPLLRRVLRGRVVYAERMHEATGRIRSLIEDGVEESEDGGVLGQFTTVAHNGGHVGSEAIMAAATSPLPSPCTVRKSSFEEFVGESPPYGSPHNSPHKSVSMDGGWDAFASPPPPPPENEMQMPSPTNGGYGFSEPNYTPPHAVPQFMTVNAPSNAAANRSWGDEFSAPVFSTMPVNASSPSAMVLSSPPSPSSMATSPWDAFPPASAPSEDLFSSGQWGGTVSGQNHFQQQQQVPVAEFRDMHLNALGGEAGPFH